MSMCSRPKSKIVTSLLDGERPSDPRYFRNVLNLDTFVFPKTVADVRAIEAQTGLRICAFEDWLAACELALDQGLADGCVALKSPLAYQRSLHFMPHASLSRRRDVHATFSTSTTFLTGWTPTFTSTRRSRTI